MENEVDLHFGDGKPFDTCSSSTNVAAEIKLGLRATDSGLFSNNQAPNKLPASGLEDAEASKSVFTASLPGLCSTDGGTKIEVWTSSRLFLGLAGPSSSFTVFRRFLLAGLGNLSTVFLTGNKVQGKRGTSAGKSSAMVRIFSSSDRDRS